MPVRKSVFASNAERTHFYKLSRRWGETYRIYHNLPFLNVVAAHPDEQLLDFGVPGIFPGTFSINHRQHAQLKKTSIDYTLCNADDAPVLAIDFDGLQQGFNIGVKYNPARPDPDFADWRSEITELKLRVAHGSLFPYYVVTYEQFRDFSKSISLTIVDGIIGEVLALRQMREVINGGFKAEYIGMTDDEFNNLSSGEQHEQLQDWLFGVEVEADFERNPIKKELARLEYWVGSSGYRSEWLTKPSADGARNQAERDELLKRAVLNGATVTVETPDVGAATRTVWVPNFSPFGWGSHLGLPEDIARLLALDDLWQRQTKAGKQPPPDWDTQRDT